MLSPAMWRVTVIRPDGSLGVSYWLRSDFEYQFVTLLLRSKGHSYVVDDLAMKVAA